MKKLKKVTALEILNAAYSEYLDRWYRAHETAKQKRYQDQYLNDRVDSLYEKMHEIGLLIKELESKN